MANENVSAQFATDLVALFDLYDRAEYYKKVGHVHDVAQMDFLMQSIKATVARRVAELQSPSYDVIHSQDYVLQRDEKSLPDEGFEA